MAGTPAQPEQCGFNHGWTRTNRDETVKVTVVASFDRVHYLVSGSGLPVDLSRPLKSVIIRGPLLNGYGEGAEVRPELSRSRLRTSAAR